jgi:hypothetical protein
VIIKRYRSIADANIARGAEIFLASSPLEDGYFRETPELLRRYIKEFLPLYSSEDGWLQLDDSNFYIDQYLNVIDTVKETCSTFRKSEIYNFFVKESLYELYLERMKS